MNRITLPGARRLPALLLLALTAALAGCAAVDHNGPARVAELARGRTAGVDIAPAADADDTTRQAVAALLAGPLTADAAVRVTLLNSPDLHAAMAKLSISDAERAQAARAPNPHFAFGRFREGDTRELERVLRFDVLGLITLPWRARRADAQAEIARLQAAQTVVRTAADARRAWLRAVSARQTAAYLRDARDAAAAGAELARRMAGVGNWSRLQQAREQALLADATAQLARAEQTALAAREQLTRLMGLWGPQAAAYTLPERLPDLPATLQAPHDLEAHALRERLDVRVALAEHRLLADSAGLIRATGAFPSLELGLNRNTTLDTASGGRETTTGAELEFGLPLFDQGQARSAQVDAQLRQSAARARAVAVRARSEVREAWHGWRTAHDLALHQRDAVVPLRRQISDEVVLRYNGMLLSVWDLLAETRQTIGAVNAAIEAQRDFWLADTDLQLALTGTSPGALNTLQTGSTPTAGATREGH